MNNIIVLVIFGFISTSSANTLLHCNWDRGDCSGDLTQDRQDQLDWSIGRGKSIEAGGPKSDHTNLRKISGRYAYIDPMPSKSANVLLKGLSSTARYITKPFYGNTGSCCVDLWYFMDNGEVDALTVRIMDTSQNVVRIHSISGSFDEPWRHLYFTFPCKGTYTASISAAVGLDYGTNGLVAIDDLTITDDTCKVMALTDDIEVRLTNGQTDMEGVVEVRLNNGEWGPVCGDNFGWKEAATVCNQLGLIGGRTNDIPMFVNKKDNFMLSNLDCPDWGTSSIDKCDHDGWGVHACRPDEAARVRCNEYEQVQKWSQVSLDNVYDGQSWYEGRVLLRHDGIWGTVCGTGWDEGCATAVCRVLGFNGAATTRSYSLYNDDMPIFIKDCDCPHDSVDFSNCSHSGFGNTDGCTHSNDAGVRCEIQEVGVPLRCGFNTLCGFNKVASDIGSWGINNHDYGISASDGAGDYSRLVINTHANDEDDVRIVSPQYVVVPSAGGVCFSCKYAVSDKTAGPLRVLRKQEGSLVTDWVAESPHTSSNVWHTVQLDIPANSGLFVFEAGVSPDYNGYIVIDNLVLVQGACDGNNNNVDDDNDNGKTDGDGEDDVDDSEDDVEDGEDDVEDGEDDVESEVHGGNDGGISEFTCDFESEEDDRCQLEPNIKSKDEQYYWRRHKGPTPSDTTGPDGAQQGSYYMYTEGSMKDPVTGATAQMISKANKEISSSEAQCLQFQVNMYGYHVGPLTVNVGSTDALLTIDPTLVEPPGSRYWAQKRVTIPVGVGGILTIQATRTFDYGADTAIDDVQLRRGEC